MGPTLVVSDQTHYDKYRGANETYRDAVVRMCNGMSSNDAHFYRLKSIIGDMSYLPAGRIQAAVGSLKKVTAGNCYVSSTIEDSMEGIMRAAEYCALTLRQGGGWGGDFSTIRPSGDMIASLGSQASGPVSFMGIFNAVCETIKSAGHRRGAMMGVLRCDHPDILDFIRCKRAPMQTQVLWDMAEAETDSNRRQAMFNALQATLRLTNFNVSVAVTDEFMQAVKDDAEFDLKYRGKVYATVRANDLWSEIMRGTWDWAEPGILFIDQINKMNNLYYCEELAATNPCFTGDTLVWTAHGPKRFDDLAKGGKTVPVLTQLDDGTIAYRDMQNPRVTQHRAKLVEVVFRGSGRKSGSITKIRCTPNHQFFLKDGTKKRADRLRPGDQIESAYKYKWNAYQWGISATSGDRVLEHHVACEYSNGRRPQYPEEHAHHKDEDYTNNDPMNIEIRESGEHNSFHMRGDKNPSRRFPDRNWLITQDWSGINNPRYRDDILDEDIISLRSSGLSYDQISSELGCCSYTVMKRLRDLHPNHTVVEVNYIEEVEDVYCGTVPSTGRFFIVNGDNEGVLVSNCGEQPLPPFGVCMLGSFNLVRYIVRRSDKLTFDFEAFKADIPPVVEGMDNIFDTATYPLPQQREEQMNKRRMGIGVTGVANAIEALGCPYGSPDFLEVFEKVMVTLRDTAYSASSELARRRGPFPLFDRDKYMQGRFIETLPEEVQNQIHEYGIRNSHLLSIAPTGTISVTADNISSGIEPVFAYEYERKMYTPSGLQTFTMQDYGVARFGVRGKTAAECTIDDHLSVLGVAAKYVDSSCSKTSNIGSDVKFGEFKDIYMRAWEMGLKGFTTFRPDGKRMGILKAPAKDKPASVSEPVNEPIEGACVYDPTTGIRTCDQ